MSDDKRARLKQWLESGEAKLHPLSLPQRELWEASPGQPGDISNHICCLIHARGALTPRDCEGAVQLVVDRQEALRLSILPGKDRALQMVRRTGTANITFRELAASENTPEGIEAAAEQVFAQPFDLLQGPLYRVEVLQRGNDEHVMAVAIHHSIADGWSLGVFIQELCMAYVQERMGMRGVALPKVAQTYTEWSAAERAYWQPAEVEKRLPYWKNLTAGYRRMWTSFEKPTIVPARALRWVSRIPEELGNAARELARAQGATLFSTLLSVFQAAVARWTGIQDILVGTPVANRGRQAIRETMGYCAGVVPLRGQVDFERPMAASIHAVHESTVDSFANAVPFAELAAALGDAAAPGYNPIYDIRFALQNHPIPDVDLKGLSAKLEMRSTGTPRFDLACEVTEQKQGLEVVWLYRTALFSRNQVEELDRLFQTVLAGACRFPASKPDC